MFMSSAYGVQGFPFVHSASGYDVPEFHMDVDLLVKEIVQFFLSTNAGSSINKVLGDMGSFAGSKMPSHHKLDYWTRLSALASLWNNILRRCTLQMPVDKVAMPDHAIFVEKIIPALDFHNSYNALQEVLAFSVHHTSSLSSAERFAMIDFWKVQQLWNTMLFGGVKSLDIGELPITDPVKDRLWHLNAVRIACKGQRRFMEMIVSVIVPTGMYAGLEAFERVLMSADPMGSQVKADSLEDSLRAAKRGLNKFALCESTLEDLVLDLLCNCPCIETSREVPPRDGDDIDKPAKHVSMGPGVNVMRIEPAQGRTPGVDAAVSNNNVPGSSAVPRASSSQLDRTGAGLSLKTKKQTKKGAASGKIVSTMGPATRAKSKAKESTPPVKAIPNRFNFQSNPRS
ncbi:hypothetical protein EVJ58_g2860 [Rhodofomes roseus]|uniref:Uncharacterized protein n=1 Tax=Rhodofomes roseus TaxID=34475 RepID=A0A4Y9YR96_9APHY|nr:hypothetical protein EVJ58_g2860 [Rhodofomes roseus]